MHLPTEPLISWVALSKLANVVRVSWPSTILFKSSIMFHIFRVVQQPNSHLRHDSRRKTSGLRHHCNPCSHCNLRQMSVPGLLPRHPQYRISHQFKEYQHVGQLTPKTAEPIDWPTVLACHTESPVDFRTDRFSTFFEDSTVAARLTRTINSSGIRMALRDSIFNRRATATKRRPT